MAYMRSEVDASSASNVTMYVGIEISSVSRSGTSVSITYKAYAYTSGYYWSSNSIGLWVNGERNVVFDSGSGRYHTTEGQKYYTGSYTTTVTVGATTSSTSVSIGANNTNYGVSSAAKWFDVHIDGLPTASSPSGVWASHSNVTRTSASLSGGYSSIGDYASYSSSSYQWGTSTNYGNSGSSLSGLSPNTTYYYKYTVTNNAGLSGSATGSFKTTGNAPNITSVSTSPSRTGCSFTINVTYDTNDSYSSRRIDYGTSTSYGSYVTGTSISNLTANTTYYYKVTINSSQGRSKTYTGSFITTGNAPSIGNVSNIPQYEFSEFNATVTYDTNAAFSSIEVQYGTTTSYGSTSTNWRMPYSGNALEHNTKYYYRFRITDNFGRTSSWKTSEFTTKGNIPIVNSVNITDIKSKYVSFDISNTFDTNANFKSCLVMIYLNSTQVYAYTEDSANITTRELKPGKNYSIVLRVRDTFDRDSDDYTFSVKTKGGFKFNGKMSDSIKINGKEVIGMKYNGIEII